MCLVYHINLFLNYWLINMSTFPENLVKFRLLAGLNQSELADKVGVTTTQISRYETGNSFPRPNIVSALANALNISIYDLTPPDDKGEVSVIDFINTERRRQGVPLHKIADKLGINQASITKIFQSDPINLTSHQLKVLADIAKVLNLDGISKMLTEPSSLITFDNFEAKDKKHVVCPQEFIIEVTGKTINHTYTYNTAVTPSSSNDASIEFENNIKKAFLKYFQSRNGKVETIVKEFNLSKITAVFTTDDRDFVTAEDDAD